MQQQQEQQSTKKKAKAKPVYIPAQVPEVISRSVKSKYNPMLKVSYTEDFFDDVPLKIKHQLLVVLDHLPRIKQDMMYKKENPPDPAAVVRKYFRLEAIANSKFPLFTKDQTKRVKKLISRLHNAPVSKVEGITNDLLAAKTETTRNELLDHLLDEETQENRPSKKQRRAHKFVDDQAYETRGNSNSNSRATSSSRSQRSKSTSADRAFINTSQHIRYPDALQMFIKKNQTDIAKIIHEGPATVERLKRVRFIPGPRNEIVLALLRDIELSLVRLYSQYPREVRKVREILPKNLSKVHPGRLKLLLALYKSQNAPLLVHGTSYILTHNYKN